MAEPDDETQKAEGDAHAEASTVRRPRMVFAPDEGAPVAEPAPTPPPPRAEPVAGPAGPPAEGASDPLLGTTLLGQFTLDRVIGEGAFGRTYLGTQRRPRRPVVVKFLKRSFVTDDQTRARFEDEADTLARIDSEHVVKAFQADALASGDLFIVMEFGGDRTLADRLREERRLPLAEALRLARQVALALQAIHLKQRVHRDLKPSNILLQVEDGRDKVKVVDLGLARILSESTHAAAPTETGTVMGTARYMSPEQASGAPAGPRSDLYALGCVLFELVSGRAPFVIEPTAQGAVWAYAHCHRAPDRLADVVPGVPVALDLLVRRLLEKSPDDRPASALEVVTALDAIAASVAPRTVFPDRRVLLGAVVVVLLALVGWQWASREPSVDPSPGASGAGNSGAAALAPTGVSVPPTAPPEPKKARPPAPVRKKAVVEEERRVPAEKPAGVAPELDRKRALEADPLLNP